MKRLQSDDTNALASVGTVADSNTSRNVKVGRFMFASNIPEAKRGLDLSGTVADTVLLDDSYPGEQAGTTIEVSRQEKLKEELRLYLLALTEDEQVSLILEVQPRIVKETYARLMEIHENTSPGVNETTESQPTIIKLNRVIDKLTIEQLEILIDRVRVYYSDINNNFGF